MDYPSITQPAVPKQPGSGHRQAPAAPERFFLIDLKQELSCPAHYRRLLEQMTGWTEAELERWQRDLALDEVLTGLERGGQYQRVLRRETSRGEAEYRLLRFGWPEGDRSRLVAACRDVTRQFCGEKARHRALRRAEEQCRRAEGVREEFLSRISHDLRTPMNSLVNLTRFAREDAEEPDKLASDLCQLQLVSGFMASLIDDVVDLSAYTRGDFQLQPEACRKDLWDGIARQVLRPMCDLRQISFTWEIDLPPDVTLLADVGRLYRICYHLVANGVKYTPEGGQVSLRLSHETAEQEHFLVLQVQDSGVGISPRDQRRLFEPFEQGDDRDHTCQGMGLGLTLVRHMTDQLGGTLTLESRPMEGSCFTLRVPARAETAPAQHPTWGIPPSLRGKTVLLAEDHKVNRAILTRLLNQAGIGADIAKDGVAAVEMFRKQGAHYDAVLMDIRMPRLNGLDAARAIRQMPTEWARCVPIVATTANACAHDVRLCLEAGMSAHLPKPIDPAQLYRTLDALLSPPNC